MKEEGVRKGKTLSIPYSGKFSRSAKFRVFCGWVSTSENKTAKHFCNAHAHDTCEKGKHAGERMSLYRYLKPVVYSPSERKFSSSAIRQANEAIKSVSTRQPEYEPLGAIQVLDTV